jgi:hypothetical protein
VQPFEIIQRFLEHFPGNAPIQGQESFSVSLKITKEFRSEPYADQ